MNVNIFDPDDYALQTSYAIPLHGKRYYFWRVNLAGMPFECSRQYTTEAGALKAGKNWLKQYWHENTY